jgi:hypothetical protein
MTSLHGRGIGTPAPRPYGRDGEVSSRRSDSNRRPAAYKTHPATIGRNAPTCGDAESPGQRQGAHALCGIPRACGEGVACPEGGRPPGTSGEVILGHNGVYPPSGRPVSVASHRHPVYGTDVTRVGSSVRRYYNLPRS